MFDIKRGNRGVRSPKLLNKLTKGNLFLLLFKSRKEIALVDLLNRSFLWHALSRKGFSSVKMPSRLKLKMSYSQAPFLLNRAILFSTKSSKWFSAEIYWMLCIHSEGLPLKFVAFRLVKINICISEVLLRAHREISKTATLRLFRVDLWSRARQVCTVEKQLEKFLKFLVSMDSLKFFKSLFKYHVQWSCMNSFIRATFSTSSCKHK